MTRGSTSVIELPSGQRVIVDASDAEMLSHWKWNLGSAGYAQTSFHSRGFSTTSYMHRMLALPSPGEEVDHINGDLLDNRRSNLRACSRAENQRNRSCQRNNTSGFKGVRWDSRRGRWRAQLNYFGRQLHLGCFDDPVEAARAYDREARRRHGRFARLNFPGGGLMTEYLGNARTYEINRENCVRSLKAAEAAGDLDGVEYWKEHVQHWTEARDKEQRLMEMRVLNRRAHRRYP